MTDVKCPPEGCSEKDFCYCVKEQMKEAKAAKRARGWVMADNFEKEIDSEGISFKRRQKTFYVLNMKIKPEDRLLTFNGKEKEYYFRNRKALVEFLKNKVNGLR